MSDAPQIRTISFDNPETIRAAIQNHEDFEIGGCQKRMSEAVLFVEREIGSEGMTSRVYTKGRAAALLVSIALPAVGIATTAALSAHNLATLNPDYEVLKRPIDGAIRLIYVKDAPTLRDHASDAYKRAASASSEAINSVSESWNKHAPNKEAVVELAASVVPKFLSKRTKDKFSAATATENKEDELAQTAIKIQSLQTHLDHAASTYAEHNKTNEFIVCLYAVGIAMAACDGHFDDEEALILKEYVVGASSLVLPTAIQKSLEKLTKNPPIFEQAMLYVEKLDRAVWPVIDDILTVISEADGEVSKDELAFMDQWQAFKTNSEHGSAA